MVILSYTFITITLFTVVRLSIYKTYFYSKKKITHKRLVPILFRGIRFDLSIFMTIFGFLIFISYLPFPFVDLQLYKYLVYILWFLIFLIVFGILVGDYIYFEYVDRHITFELNMLRTEAGVLLKYFIRDYWYLFLLTLFCIVLLALGWFQVPKIFSEELIFQDYSLSIIRWLIITFLIIFFAHGNNLSGKPLATVDSYNSATKLEAALIMNGLFSVVHYMYKSRKKGSLQVMNYDSAIKRIIEITQPYKTLNLPECPLLQYSFPNRNPELPEKPNIAIIIVEGFNSHNISSIFDKHKSPWLDLNIMPYTEELVKNSCLYTNFFANGQRTIDTVHTLLTSIPRMGNLPLIGYDQDFSNVNYQYLPQLLKKNGYKTTVFNGPWSRSIRMNSIASLSGFDNYIPGEQINDQYLGSSGMKKSDVGAWDEHLFEMVFDELKKCTAPYFTQIYSATGHAPYEVPDKKYEVYGKNSQVEKYHNCMSYLDKVFSRFFDKVESEKSFDNTIFFILGDHILFNLGGDWDPVNLFHLPLIIYNKKYIKPGVETRAASHMDLFPTILEMVGNKYEHTNFGRSLLNKNLIDYSVMVQGDMIHSTDGEKWIVFPEISLKPEKFSIKDGYFLEKNEKLNTGELELTTKAYYQSINSLYRKNGYYYSNGIRLRKNRKKLN